ncbi:MAG: hypothetical protein QOG92_851 [Verrucomicrobiota bacterium]|nr:hypothetical protein [Verrucomicrobiota bacterium]
MPVSHFEGRTFGTLQSKLPVAETNLNWGQARYPGGTRENQDKRIPIGKPYLALFHNI